MKYYQCKNERKYYNPLLIIHTIMWGFLAIEALSDYDLIASSSESERIIYGVLFLLIALFGVAAYIYNIVYKRYERMIEITEDEIIYHAVDRTARMKWNDVANVSLHKFFFSSINRVVFFNAKGAIPYIRKSRITDKRMWSEYDDEMLAEIKKYWHRRIGNYDRYMKYKEKKLSKQQCSTE